MTDILLEKNSLGYYDIDFDDDGDFVTTDGLDTAIIMSILCEKRADKSEITRPEFRRGDWSDELNDVTDYEVGSKFWLLYVARADEEALNFGIDVINEGLQWMIDDKLIKEVVTTGVISVRGITFTIKITQADDEIETFSFPAFEDTGA